MRIKSWIAAAAVIAGTTTVVSLGMAMQSGQPSESPTAAGAPAAAPAAPHAAEQATGKNRVTVPLVKLSLGVAGLARGGEGCEVDVKPGNAGCKFRPLSTIHINSAGFADIDLRDVEIRGADKLLSLAITIREAGQQPKTIYRAFRFSARPPTETAPPTFACYVSSPSKVARLDDEGTRKK